MAFNNATCSDCGKQLSGKRRNRCLRCNAIAVSPNNQGETNGMAKLNDAKAAEIKKRAIEGEHPSQLSVEFNISVEVVQRIASGAAWSHVEVDATPPALPTGNSEYAIVPGWPTYAAGKDGSLWNFRYGRWRKLNGTVQRQGYLSVQLKDKPRSRRTFIHRIILQSFVGPCPDNMEACHYNGIKDDNRLSNLRWDTKIGNREDGRRLGEIARGEQRFNSKITESDARYLKDRFASRPVPTKEVAAESKRMGVATQTALAIIYGRSWVWLD